jgi:LacI family transcriptional regulator
MVIEMPSIREIAKMAHVSPATVSRVLNGTAVVDPETRDRVLRVVQETGYRPNEIARSLSKRSSRIIGCIVPNIVNPFFNEVARAIEDEAYDHGYRLVLCNSDEDPAKEIEYIDMLIRMNADGIIITTIHADVDEVIRNCPIPVILLDRSPQLNLATAGIRADHYQGGRLAAQHMIDCGCQTIVHMKGPQKYASGRLRLKGYLDICKEQGRTPLTIDCDYNFDDGLRQAAALLDQFPTVDGIIAPNDLVAVSVYKILTNRHIAVPAQIQIIGFDDIFLSALMTPALTTIAQPIIQIGTLAASIIIARVEGQPVQTRDNILPVELIVRETTRPKT